MKNRKYPKKGILKDILRNAPKKSSPFKYAIFSVCLFLAYIEQYFIDVFFSLTGKFLLLFERIKEAFAKCRVFINSLPSVLNSQAEKEVFLFKTNYSLKPFLLLQGAAVFAVVLFSLVFFENLLFPAPPITQQSIIRAAAVKQVSTAITENNNTVKWTMVIKRDAIANNQNKENGQYLAQLPKNATNIKVKAISAKEAKDIITKTQEDPKNQLTLEDRKAFAFHKSNSQLSWLASVSSPNNIFSEISFAAKYFFADLEESASEIIEQTTEKPLVPEVIETDESTLVDLSELSTESALDKTDKSDKKDTKEGQKEEKPAETSKEDSGGPATTSPEASLGGETTETTETVTSSNEEIIKPETPDQNTKDEKDDKEYVKVDFETPSPTITEQETETGKLVTVKDPTTDPNQPQMTNVLAHTTIPEIYKVGEESRIKIKWKNNNEETMPFTAYDLNSNGKIDYIEWTVPHLSDQVFEIIFISKAWQLDQNQNIIADIYEQVKSKDDVWTTIPNSNYIRATFESILDNTKDNTIYARPAGVGHPLAVEVYPVYADANGNQTQGQLVATFPAIDHEGTYKVLLTNLQTPTDVFDLKVLNGDLDVDWVVDPATDRYWVGGTGNWSDAANHWAATSGGAAGAGNLPVTGDNVIFDANSGSGTVTINSAGVSMQNVSEGNANITIATSTNGITITGDLEVQKTISGTGAVTFSGAGKTITGGSSATISAPLTLGASVTVSVDSGTLTISGIVSGATYAIDKTGPGQLTLSGANTFTGGLTIKTGTVSLATSTSAGGGSGTGTITIGDTSGSSDATLSGGSSITFANPITVAAGSSGTLSITTTFGSTFREAVTLSNNLTISNNGAVGPILSGGITGTGNIIINNTTTSAIAISTTSVNHTGTITNSGSGTGTVTISSVIGTNVTGVVQNSATSQLTLSGVNTFTSGLTIKAGTVSISTSTSAGGGSGTGTITIGDTSGSANATLSGGSSITFANPITVAAGSSGTLSITSTASPTFSGAVTLNNNLTLAAGWLTLSGGITGTGNIIIGNTSANGVSLSTTSVNNTGTITNSGSGSGTTTISAVIGTNVTGVVQNSSTSQLTLSGNNTFSTGLTIKAGTAALSTSTTAAGTGTITIGNTSGTADATLQGNQSGTAANQITVAAGSSGTLSIIRNGSNPTFSGAITLNNNLTVGTIGSSGITFTGGVTGTGNIIVSNATGPTTFSTTSVNNTGTITNSGSGSGTTTISAVIGTNVTGVIQNSTTSQLTLSGANTFTSGLTIQAGTVSLTTSTSAGGGSGTGTITIGDTSGSTAATLQGDGRTFANPIVLATGTTGTLTIQPSATSCIFSGGVTGTNNLTLNGSSTFTLTLSTASVNNVGTVTNANAGTGTVTISSVIGTNVTGVVQNSSTSQLTLSGNNTFSSGLTVKAGIAKLSTSANAAGTGTITLGDTTGSNAAYLFAGTNGLTFANPISLATNASVGTLAVGNTGVGISTTFSGGVTGTNNFTIYNFAITGDVTFSTVAINNSGTVTNIGDGTGTNIISGGIGSNVTGITQNSTSTGLTINTTAITVNSSGTTLTNSTGNSLALTVTGGVTGTGNLILNNNSSTASGINLTTTSINNTGTITNSGSGTGTVTISSVIGSNVTGITQNSSTSQLTLSGNNSTVGGVTITSGVLELSGTTNLNISGSWTNSVGAGGFTANTSTVTLTTGTHTLTGATTFNNLTLNANNTVTFPASTTQTIGGAFSCTGTAGNTITINSSTPGTKATLSDTTGTNTCDYMSITDSSATGGAIWVANHSTGSNYDGWTGFNTAPTLTSVATSPNPIKGGNQLTITPTGQGDTESDTLYYYCAESTAPTSATTLCSQANTSYTTPYSSMTCTYNVSTGDATRTVYCRTYDGTDYSTERTTTYTVDTTAPSVGATTLSGFTTYSTYITGTGTIVGGTATDTGGSGIDNTTCEYTSDNGGLWSAGTWSTNHCQKTSFTISNGTSYTFNTRVKDLVANQGTGTATSSYTGDTAAPTTTDNSDTNWHATNQTITLTPSDGTGSGIGHTYYCVDTNNTCTPTTEGTSVSVTCSASNTCQQYVRYYSVDNLSNSESVKTSNLVKIDTAAPITAISANNSNNNITVTLTCADTSGSGCSLTYYCYDTTNTCTPTTLYTSAVAFSITATTYFRYYSVDFSSNTGSTSSETITTVTATVSGGSGPSSSASSALSKYTETTETILPPKTPPTIIEQIAKTPQQVAEQVQQIANQVAVITNQIAVVFGPKPPETLYPPIAEAVPPEAQKVFQGGVIVSKAQLDKIAILPLPQAIKNLALKFPQFATTLEKTGITKPENIRKLQVAKLTFPGLSEASGAASNLSLSKFTAKEVSQIPTDFVFARIGKNNIDLKTKIIFSNKGEPIQTINTIENRPLYLVVNPSSRAESIKGYVIFKSANSKSAFLNFINKLSAVLSASLLEATNLKGAPNQANSASSTEEVKASKDIVLNEFSFKKNDNGVWEANLLSPAVSGKYEIRTEINYANSANKEKIIQEASMIMVVDPEGYIFRKDGNDETRIANAAVSIYWLNPNKKQYELWPAKDFQQQNPQITDITGRYAFLVPPGDYYIEVVSKDYLTYQTDQFEVAEGSAVHMNIELKLKNWFFRLFSADRIMTGIVIILLIFILSAIIVKRKNNIVQ